MNALKQATWFFCVLIGLACTALYFASSSPTKKIDDNALSRSADIIITNLAVRRFDEAGKLTNYLLSPEMKHIPDNDMHFFKTPRILISQADQPAWEIRSQQAKAVKGGEQITFIHEVVIHQNKSKQAQESTMKTEELTYFPKEKLASTDLAVRFEQPDTIVHSNGMRAYLADKRVKLMSQARATYKQNNA